MLLSAAPHLGGDNVWTCPCPSHSRSYTGCLDSSLPWVWKDAVFVETYINFKPATNHFSNSSDCPLVMLNFQPSFKHLMARATQQHFYVRREVRAWYVSSGALKTGYESQILKHCISVVIEHDLKPLAHESSVEQLLGSELYLCTTCGLVAG